MLVVGDDSPQDLILQVCLLNCVVAYFAIDHPEVRFEVFGKRVVPILEVPSCTARSVIARIASLFLLKGVVELIFGAETSVELIFEVVHKLTVPGTLEVVVLQGVIVDVTFGPVVVVAVPTIIH